MTRNHSDEMVSREIKSWVVSFRFSLPQVARVTVKWEIPQNQSFATMDFTSNYIGINLTKALGVSYQDIQSSTFEVVGYTILIDNIPKDLHFIDW